MFDFSEMLPVGMVVHGGQVAQIMADIAKRQRGLKDWEAFHYERISDTCYELTGGIVSTANGSKRWLEPHDCISVPITAIIIEMQKIGLIPTINTTESPPSTSPSNATQTISGTTLLQVSLALPDDEIGRQRILKAFHLHADFFGARVVACKMEH